ncbi:patatin-like phospholipase family protein [Anaerosalibacter bizertensis]|uniref:Patatin-like phospholipase family protein n=1 Tax=Anaerosalibacter bizertensis TaxID=932217 RepID=A0A9Q4ADZ3_9FIRM|nr:patatin-like phospholipase family protein [Anaerosalibacter bizertensis]MBV1820090.1 patatin-like phospholipase family protein [Bacteroidales bacterium MSK.15.36]MCB5560404.1 patatin-like phospholipase family protein [Anaerosalibacter bizertensis]MCG4565947.1 patatin-like phospholipase family protein [Anaerosalibacter bizertensis]MCG4582224.1 patatin-like phospholipase family protein [Anaerosalibacter bizertensis]MCG4585417.1 patatin-like phospholipase family protein [Anaerosalibacter bizer
MYGLVLEGGGAKGAYHIGAYKAIKDMNIEIGGVAGTSVGALNGAAIAQDDFEKAYELWYNMCYSKVMNADDIEMKKLKKGKLTKEDIKSLSERIKGVINEKGIDVTPLKDLLFELVDEDKIRNSGKDFGIVTVSLTDLKPLELYIEDIPEGKLVEYLLASAYFPAFKKEKINGKMYIDGGIYNNLPINLLSNKGYKDIIAIRTHGPGRLKKNDNSGLNIIYISPNDDLGKTLDFDGEVARKNLKLGYYDGLKALKGLKGYKYYIESKKDEDYFIDIFLNTEENKIIEIGEILGIGDIPYRRALFEYIIPRISDVLGLKKENTYEEIAISFLEELAIIYNIERFKVYNYDDFLNIVKKEHRNRELEEKNIFYKIVNKVDFLSVFNREDIIKRVADIIFRI